MRTLQVIHTPHKTVSHEGSGLAVCFHHGRHIVSLMRHNLTAAIWLLMVLLLFTACKGRSKHFNLSGRLLNINQGAFYIYAMDAPSTTLDTIRVEGGRFSYSTECEDPMTLVMVFPNYSEQPIFAQPGASVDITGDATHLKEMKVEGTDDNELMNQWREQTAQLSPPQVQRAVTTFVHDHPESMVSQWLVRRYLLAIPSPRLKEAKALVALMRQKQKATVGLARLELSLRQLAEAPQGEPLPRIEARDDRNRPLPASLWKKGTTVVVTWASWSYDSQDLLRRISQWQREANNRFQVLSVCLDADARQAKQSMGTDSIRWPNVCDGKMFDSPIVNRWALHTVPCVLLVKDGKVVARDLSPTQLQEKLGVKP